MHLVEPNRAVFRSRVCKATAGNPNAQDVCRYVSRTERYCEAKEAFSVLTSVDRTNDRASKHLDPRNLEAEESRDNASCKAKQTNKQIHFSLRGVVDERSGENNLNHRHGGIQTQEARMIDPRIKVIFNHYGFRHQLSKLKEECLELVEAIDTFEKESLMNWTHVEEEMADVLNVIDQFQVRMYSQMHIDEIRDRKLDRQIARIAAEISAKEVRR